MDSLRDDLRAGLKAALKGRDRAAAAAIRSALAAIENAEAVPAADGGPAAAVSEHVAGAAVGVGAADTARRTLTAADERAVLTAEIAEHRSAADSYADSGHPETAARLRADADLLDTYLGRTG
ncbi:hypothetical protein [Nocardiopsis coralliicola]